MQVQRDHDFHDVSTRFIIFGTTAVPGTQPVYSSLATARFLVKKDPHFSNMTSRSLVVRSISTTTLQSGARLPYGNFTVKRDRNLHDTFIITRSSRI